MIFTEPRFLLFFLVVLSVHWALRHNGSRKLWLLAVSYLFYAAWDWRYLTLIVASTVIDFIAAREIHRARTTRRRKGWLLASLAVNLGLLGTFKYFNFFVDSLEALLGSFGVDVALLHLDVVLPVGISFYTFQTLSYSIDVYFGRLKPVRGILDLAVFVGFFPQLVAGPIVRASTFLPQLVTRRRWADVDVRSCLTLFLIGFVKKACISDNVSPVVDRVFGDAAAYGAGAHAIAVLLFAVQLYCDFSGYTDMAVGSARLLGYELCPNFDFPYFSRDINEFWRRWHISLSSWFRDYVYIPLGGGRAGPAKRLRNLYVTVVLTGFWHGAAWNFVLFGAYHATLMALHGAWSRRLADDHPLRAAVRPLAVPVTFYAVAVSMILFRSQDAESAWIALRAFAGLGADGTGTVSAWWLALFVALAAVHALASRGFLKERVQRMPDWAYAISYGVCAALVWPFVPSSHAPFIYFQF